MPESLSHFPSLQLPSSARLCSRTTLMVVETRITGSQSVSQSACLPYHRHQDLLCLFSHLRCCWSCSVFGTSKKKMLAVIRILNNTERWAERCSECSDLLCLQFNTGGFRVIGSIRESFSAVPFAQAFRAKRVSKPKNVSEFPPDDAPITSADLLALHSITFSYTSSLENEIRLWKNKTWVKVILKNYLATI